MGRSTVLAQLFVVAADEVGVAVGDWVAVNWDQGVAGFAAGQFIGDASTDFQKRFHDLQLNYGPIGFFALTCVFLPGQAGAFAGDRDAVAQFGNINHFFNIAQAICPLSKIVAGNGTSKGRALFIEEAIPVAAETATDVAAFVAAGRRVTTVAIGGAASAVASALSELEIAGLLVAPLPGPLPIGWGEGGISRARLA